MGILMVIFAVAIGYATFIENDFDPSTARLLVYNARWFEILLFMMVLNFSGMIYTKRLYHRKKWNILAMHVALIIIIIGAGLTRYLGFEGIMHIRNGETSNTFTSVDTFFKIETQSGESIREKVLLSGKGRNFLSGKYTLDGSSYKVSIKEYIPQAEQKLVAVPDGNPYLNLLISHGTENHVIYLEEGESMIVHELGISFGDTTLTNYVHIYRSQDELKMRIPVNYRDTTRQSGKPRYSKFIPLTALSKYRFTGNTLMLMEYYESGQLQYVNAENSAPQNQAIARVQINEEEFTLPLNQKKQVTIDGRDFSLYLGTIQFQLPFALKLNKFELDRYPGSNSPSSFASDIELIDQKENLVKPYRIFMNNILSHKGYRFYQSSYDQDEQGTILSVNRDYWGTVVTYIGYFLLFATLIISFFTRKTRFAKLRKQFNEVQAKRQSLTASLFLLFLFGGSFLLQAQDDSEKVVDRDHAARFGALQVQNDKGRMMPVNTLTSDFLVKIYKKDSYGDLTSDQVFLEFISNPSEWLRKPMIKIGDPEIQKKLGVKEDYANYMDFFTMQSQYKLEDDVNAAYMKKPAIRSKYDKEIIYVDERLNVMTMLVNEALLRIFPIPFHPDNSWGTPKKFSEATGKTMFEDYLNSLREAKKTGNYEEANMRLNEISNYQKSLGKEIVLSDRKVNLEIFYNKSDIFKRLFPVYMMLGIILTGFFFLQVFIPRLKFTLIYRAFTIILSLAFLIQTAGLVLRWYISGHAPWSNGYESMIYISWVTMLAGLLFVRKSTLVLAVTAILAGITLLTAHMSWLNPEITNLVPVLKSYWLTIHVATITASYGFLGLVAMMGFMNLGIMIFRNQRNQKRINLILEELTIIIEMSMIIGLVLLIIGNFLGAIWANESWGRYWGWDPKETWTLVTIIVYSFILHMNLIPRVKSLWSFNFLSLIGFATILMTYFGVNYYLSGLHSYAQGDPVPIPIFVYYLLAIVFTVSLFAGVNAIRLKSSEK